MKRYALLLGSAPEDFRQKKIEDMSNFLESRQNAGGSVVTFANGISELMLEMVMDNSVRQLSENSGQITVDSGQKAEISEQKARHSEKNICHSATQSCHSELDSESVKKVVSSSSTTTNNKMNSILLYICTLQPVSDNEKSFWLGGEEIRRDVILHYLKLAAECGIDMQVIFDFDSELVSEKELGWEEVEDCRVKPDNDSFGHFETQNCHSEFISESTKQTLKRVQGDNDMQVQHGGLFGGAI